MSPVWLCPLRLRSRAALAAVPAAARPAVRELRLLGHGAAAAGRARRLPQPARRGRGHRARRAQVAVLDVFYTEEEFWALYNGPAYAALKASYDPAGRLPDLYDKCVRRAVTKGAGADGTGRGLRAESRARRARCGSTAYDGSTRGRRRRAGHDHRPLADRGVLPGARHPAASGWPARTCPAHLDVEGDMYTALARMLQAQRMDLDFAERLPAARASSAGHGCCCRGYRRRRRRSGRPPVAVRPPALQGRDASAISHHYDVSNASTSGCSARRWPTRAPCYPTADATLEQAQAHKFDLVARKLGLQPGHAAARRRLRLGRHGHARGPRVRRPRARRHAVASSRRAGRSGRSRRPGCPTWPRSATWTTATSPRPASTRSARSG